MEEREKWHANNKNKGYSKIHIAVYVKTKKILTIKVMNMHVHDDGNVLPELVEENIISSDSMTTTIGKLFCDDGPYESNDL